MNAALLYAAASYADSVVAGKAAQYALEQGNIAREQERLEAAQQSQASEESQPSGE